MSSYQPKKGEVLAGKRIDPDTELGKELAKLRLSYAMSGAVHTKDDDKYRRILETSLNVNAPLDKIAQKREATQRRKLIRTRITDAMNHAHAVHGRPATTIGIPGDMLEEVALACSDFDVVFIAQEDVG